MSIASQLRCVKRKAPTTPRNAHAGVTFWSPDRGTYNAGRNESKRRNRQADIRGRVAARSKR